MSISLLHLANTSIFDQLQLEEALLRGDNRNWCIINEGSAPAIVMGISGKADELIDKEQMIRAPVPIIKRFSGGGTVIVNEDTLFVTFIFEKNAHPFPAYPEPIMQWSADFYRSFFPEGFDFRENDYVIGEKKCGGNAQYIKKDRWLHHTSFLWDFKSEQMSYLLYPKKTPKYRQAREHKEFLCRLCDFIPDKKTLISELKKELTKRYCINEVNLEDARKSLENPQRQTTTFIEMSLSGALC